LLDVIEWNRISRSKPSPSFLHRPILSSEIGRERKRGQIVHELEVVMLYGRNSETALGNARHQPHPSGCAECKTFHSIAIWRVKCKLIAAFEVQGKFSSPCCRLDIRFSTAGWNAVEAQLASARTPAQKTTAPDFD
jgi:hypothetical protein